MTFADSYERKEIRNILHSQDKFEDTKGTQKTKDPATQPLKTGMNSDAPEG